MCLVVLKCNFKQFKFSVLVGQQPTASTAAVGWQTIAKASTAAVIWQPMALTTVVLVELQPIASSIRILVGPLLSASFHSANHEHHLAPAHPATTSSSV